MSESDYLNTQMPPAPPTFPGAILQPQRESVWPKVIGIIAIVVGALGSLSALWGVVSARFMGRFMDQMGAGQAMGDMGFEKMWSWTLTASVITLPVAVLLLVAGVGIVQRRRWGLKATMAWAVVKIVVVVVTSIGGYMVMREQLRAMARSGPTTMPTGFMETMQFAGVVVGILWGWALPIFMLVWFSRAKIKAETVIWA